MLRFLICLIYASTATAADIQIQNRGDDSRPLFVAVNKSHTPMQVVLNLTKLQNMNTSKRYHPVSTVVPARSEKEVVRLWPANPNRGTSWSYTSSYYLGNPSARPTNYTYSLPFKSKDPRRVTQSFGGKSTHNRQDNYYAVDIEMPEGTPILAARSGKVIAIEQRNIAGGTRKELLSKSNYIQILHSDGTYADYAHLRWASIRPRLGSYVKEGQVIAQSGNVGYSSGPHLHFTINRNFGASNRAIPFKFTTGTPKYSQILISSNPIESPKAKTGNTVKTPTAAIEWSSKSK